jgi:hypothetical protein
LDQFMKSGANERFAPLEAGQNAEKTAFTARHPGKPDLCFRCGVLLASERSL